MKRLAQTLQSFATIEKQLQDADRHNQNVKRQAWMTSGKTIGRARQLITEATLSLLAQGSPVDVDRLDLEVRRLARDGDRFAVDLCDDWLNVADDVAAMRP